MIADDRFARGPADGSVGVPESVAALHLGRAHEVVTLEAGVAGHAALPIPVRQAVRYRIRRGTGRLRH